MASLAFFNFAATTLAGPISTTQTTCNVAAGSGALFPLPTGQFFKLVLLDAQTKLTREIVNVTAVNGDTLTIVRGQEGTTASNYAAGDIAGNLITAGSFAAFAQVGNLPTSFVTGQDTGTANAVAVPTTTPAVSAPAVGQLFLITKGGSSNTGATTFQIASGTAYSVVYKDGSALTAGDWPAASAALLYFTGGVMQYLANAGNVGVRTYFGRATGTADAVTVATVPPVPALGDNVDVEFVNVGAANATTTPTLTISSAGAATTIFRNDGSPCQPGDLPANGLVSVKFDSVLYGSCWRLRSPITPAQVRRKLSGNLNLYVRNDGNDANSGLANNAGAAFQTLQGCWNAIFGLYDPAGFTITINVGVGVGGTFSGATLGGYTGAVVLSGDPAATSSVVLNSGTLDSLLVHPAGGPQLTIQNLVLDFTFTGASSIEATINSGASLTIGNGVTFRCTNNRANLIEVYSSGSGASVLFGNNTTVTVAGAGARSEFIQTSAGASMNTGNSPGVTVTFNSVGTIAYSNFTNATSNSSQSWGNGVFTGFTATGNRAAADGNATISLGGKTLPGSTGPTTPTHGGQIF